MSLKLLVKTPDKLCSVVEMPIEVPPLVGSSTAVFVGRQKTVEPRWPVDCLLRVAVLVLQADRDSHPWLQQNATLVSRFVGTHRPQRAIMHQRIKGISADVPRQ